jgi:hypothetical protein
MLSFSRIHRYHDFEQWDRFLQKRTVAQATYTTKAFADNNANFLQPLWSKEWLETCLSN